MGKFQHTFKALRKSRGLTQEELSKQLKLSRSAIGMYESGAREPDFETLEVIADFFNVDINYLLGRTTKTTLLPESNQTVIPNYPNIRPISTQSLPMLGSIACGEPVLMSMDRKSYVQLGTEVKADFCLTANGDSMINARIHDGDIVFIRKQDMVENGEIAAVAIDDEATTTKSSPFSYYGLKIHLTRTRRIPGKR